MLFIVKGTVMWITIGALYVAAMLVLICTQNNQNE